MKILIIYSTTDGHTKVICDRLDNIFKKNGHTSNIILIDDISSIDLKSFDQIVIGASIRYGKHSKKIITFINENLTLLDSLPNAFFSVNVVARKPEKNTPETNPYLIKFLKSIAWKPKKLAVFAGKIDYPSYSYIDRQMIRLIMLMTKGPTDPTVVVEFTDWNQVEQFGENLSKINFTF